MLSERRIAGAAISPGRVRHLDVSLAECAMARRRHTLGRRALGAGRATGAYVSPANDLFQAADGEWLALALVEESSEDPVARPIAGSRHHVSIDARHRGPTRDRGSVARAARGVARRDQAVLLEATAGARPCTYDLPITRIAQDVSAGSNAGVSGLNARIAFRVARAASGVRKTPGSEASPAATWEIWR